MRSFVARGWWLSAALAVCGCGGSTPTQVVPAEVVRLGEKTDTSLAAWLALPRAELAKLADEKEEAVFKLQEFSRHNPEAVNLLPHLHLSAQIPVFQKATYAESAGFSLPPYLKPGQRDDLVALHLASYGDIEAALKLAGPKNEAIVEKISHFAGGTEYPVEWARLVALTIYEAEFKLAGGDVDAATEVALVHKQLQEVLDAKSKAGALGAALLPLGKRALSMASIEWRSETYKKSALADDLTAVVASWGEVPAPPTVLRFKAPKEEVAAFLGRTVKGHAVAAEGPAVARSLDLFALPLVREGVEVLVAFFDDKEALSQLLLAYKPRINQEFPEPRDLAQGLTARGLAGGDPTRAEGLLRQSAAAGGSTFDINLFTRTTRLGALVRVSSSDGQAPATHLPNDVRNLGVVQLDQSFEQNRLAVRPDARGIKVEANAPAVLAKLATLIKEPSPSSIILERDPGHNLVQSITLHWAAENNGALLDQFVLLMWSAYGAGRFEPIADDAGGHFDFVWENSTTRYALRLPNDDQLGSDLIIADSRGQDGLKARLEAVARSDKVARKARFAAGKVQKRLPRLLHLDSVKLGMPKAQALAALPHGRLMRQTPLADGVNLMFLNPVDPATTHSARQMFIRFGPGDKVAEIRVRYQIGPKKSDKQHKSLLDTLHNGANGAPESLPAPWAKLWTDLPPEKPAPELLSWSDDLTVMTYQHDAGGAEVTLLDADQDHPLGVVLPPLRFVSQGIDHCRLGDSKGELLKRWQIDRPQTTADGALYFGQPDASPYDIVLVWFEEDLATRIVARHKLAKNKLAQADQISSALQEYWGRNIDQLGQLRRHNGPWGQVYATYGWHDDKNRVVTHIQDTEPDGPRMFTEWREWPLPDKNVAVKP